jgi:hypothetical protein
MVIVCEERGFVSRHEAEDRKAKPATLIAGEV